MNSRLPRLTSLVVLLTAAAFIVARAGGGAVGAPDSGASNSIAPPAESQIHQPSNGLSLGDQLLMQSSSQLERRGSVSARLRHQCSIGGDPLYGVGSYWQQGSGDSLRVRLELQVAGQEASLLQISNSRFLWIDRRLPNGRNVTRIDLRQLRARPELSPTSLDDVQPGNASWSSADAELLAYCGGLPSLLASLRENFSFLPRQAMRLAVAPPAASQASSIPVFAVVGHWKPERLAALLGRKSATTSEPQSQEALNSQLSALHSVPARMPQEVLILVGQADLFPYRIEYRRLETPLAAPEGATIPYQLSPNPLVVLELTDVAFDVPVAAGQFDYAPGDADWVDQTAAAVERLRRDRQEQVAARSGTDSERK